jgi:hypothetical protein
VNLNEFIVFIERVGSEFFSVSNFEMNQIIPAYNVRVNGEITFGDELAEKKAIPPERLRPWEFGAGPAVSDWLARRKKT